MESMWSEGDLVWFTDTNFLHPLPGEIQEVHRAAQVIIVQAVINGKPQTFTLGPGEGSLQRRQDLGSSGVDDMTQLEDLHEASLLWNLRIRYDVGQIYTFAGSILIAVNPYKMIPDSYGIQMAKKYAAKPLGTMPPHLFAIAAAAHAALPTPQVVVISGESGAGKTESTKLVMQYLAAVVPGGGSASAVITEQILEAGPLLEVFGNARTTRNDNSSRFGKYVEVYFKHGAIVGAKITQYLLEKSRIVTHAPGERNYHVFYELFGGLSESERSKYGLLDVNKYFYLNQGGSDCGPGRVDWASLQGAMQVLGVSDKEQNGIIRILASVLHLGNIYFHRRQLRHGQEGVELGSDAEVKWAAHLLQIADDDLHRVLTTRLTETRTERLYTPLGIDQALDSRDAFAKVLYSGLFNWLVSRINSIVHKGGTHDAYRISILDIFGFEDFPENSFEQLCINFANENLQLYFNKHVFKLEQAEYARERLEWNPLPWEDNLPVIHLLAKKPVGIFHLLDDESNFPRASDLSFLEKCHYNHALNELYSRPRIGAQEFGVTHYAGQVWYNVEGFLEKNRDAVRPDVLELLSSSDLPIMKEIFKQLRAQRDNSKSLPKGANGRFVTMKPRTPTVAARFSDSLQHLLQSMAKCNPWFIRCVKPNNEKHALRMDMPCVLQQLRYLGMLDTIRIRQKGYPVRLRFQHFVERYRHMLKAPLPRGTPYRDLCRSVLETIPATGVDGPDFQLGATRVFLREAIHRVLETNRSERQRDAAVIIQRNVRKMLSKKHLRRRKRAATKIQSAWKGYRDRKRYHNLKRGTVQLQALFRGRRQRKMYQKLKAELQRRRNVERAQRERHQKAVAAEQERSHVVQLDVPAELAFIFSKLDGWNSLHGDRHLVKVVGTVPGPPNTFDLPSDLDQFAFGKFSSVYCNGVKLAPRRDPITSPFLSRAASRDEDFQSSLAVFKLILRWTNDKNLDIAKEKALADYIVHKGLSSRSVRDEIFVQLCNQVYKVDESQSLRVWQLMGHCLSSFQPGHALHKYLIKFVADNAPTSIKESLLRKLLRNSGSQLITSRLYPPTWLEWRANARNSDIALSLTLPDEATQTVAIDSWTTCEEAAALALSSIAVPPQGWTVVLDDSGLVSDSNGLDFVLDLISEKELCPAFPTVRSDLLRCGRKNSKIAVAQEPESPNPKRPNIPPPEPPMKRHSTNERIVAEQPIPQPVVENKPEFGGRNYEGVQRKTSHDLLSRNSALNDRYFDSDKTRSKSMDDLLAGESVADSSAEVISQAEQDEENEELAELGLSESRLNDRYHSVERLAPLRETPRYQKYAGRRSAGHSNKYMERSDYGTRSSAMSDTSEAPSLASHVRRVRVPSNVDQFSDVDQYLDDLFSPVLDGSLDELSDARSLSTSIRGGRADFFEAPEIDTDFDDLQSAHKLHRVIKGGGHKNDNKENEKQSQEAELNNATALDEYITELFQPIFVNDSLKRLTEKTELADSIKGGGTAHQTQSSSNGYGAPSKLNPVLVMGTNPENFTSTSSVDKTELQRAFLQSAMAQNIQIQQQLLAQNQALQTLLSQQDSGSASSSKITQRKQSFKSRSSSSPFNGDFDRNRKSSAESNSHIPPPPPPPMPPPIEFNDPSGSRPFLDPYGRAKTVRIGKWVWPPKDQALNDENFMEFKMRQNQRKNTPQSNTSSPNGSSAQIEWDELEVENVIVKNGISATSTPVLQQNPRKFSQENAIQATTTTTAVVTKIARRSFEIGAERPPPGSVGKLKLSSEMRQRLEQVTAGHSVRSTTSTESNQRTPAKLEDARRMMLQQALSGHFGSNDKLDEPDLPSVRTQVKRMEAAKGVIPPAPKFPPPPIPGSQAKQPEQQEIPSFYQKRHERDTFGIHQSQQQNWNGSEVSKDTYDSWGRAEAAKHDIYDHKKEKNDREPRSRSRSRSRDRENFSESVWDRNEVEGESDTRERMKEREKHDRIYEMKQVERERESQKVYQPSSTSNKAAIFEKEKAIKKSPAQMIERATFKTHMARMDRERKNSASTQITQSTDKPDDMTDVEWHTNAPPAPVPPVTKLPAAACLTYNRVPWKLRVRKEVFHPTESISSPAALDLLFAQVAGDVLGLTSCLRISPQEKRNGLNLLGGHGVNTETVKTQQVRAIVKRHLIDMARNWPLYFARLFIVSGSPQFPEVSLLAVSHSGVYLARRETEHVSVVRSVPLADLQGAITLPRPAALQLNLKNGNRIVLHAPRATAIQIMIQTFCQEFKKVQSKASTISSGARAAAQTLNVPIERLEAQVHGGVVKSPGSPTVNNNHHEKSHRHHSIDEIIPSHIEHNGKHSSQPHSYVSQESPHGKSHHSPAQSPQQHSMSPVQMHGHHKNGHENGQLLMHPDEQDDQQQFSALSAMQPTPITNAKYTLLQFAMQHFRDDNQVIEDHELNGRAKKRSTSSRPHGDLVKWQGSPIRSPLLRLPVELSPLAIECFECILRYCGDLPPDPELTEVKCVYTILMHCHKHLTLRDEVYCQLMKQTTGNRSANPDSCQRAWRLLSILAAYFSCSDALKPYLMEHLTAAASDRRRAAHGTAGVCLSNLRKTARCGGRKNVPSVEEVTAVSAGRSARRQIYRLPGGAERVVNTRGSTVVADVIAELCGLLGIDSPIEQQEFSLYCIVQGDAFTMPLAADEYILDVTTELLKSGQPFYLIFCRSVWHFPLKRDPMPTLLYVEVLFNQVAPDYLEGLLLELPGGGAPSPDVVRDMARIAVLLHRAADLNHVPAMKEIKFLLPKPALGIRELRPAQWVALVQSAWPSVAGLEPVQVKAQFLAVLAEWPLFGSSFFAVRKVWAEDGLADDSSPIWKEIILALNRRGVLFLDPNTHETLRHWPFMEVISTRKVRSDDGALYLDMKMGNLMQQRVIRVQTEQAHEISRLIRQYITMAQMSRPDRRE